MSTSSTPPATPPRWNCGVWQPEVGWLHILSDIAIFFAYAAIPATLLFFILRRRDIPLRGIFWLFAAFILSCGLTHLTDATMFYHPIYRFLGVMKFITAAVSILTVFALIRVLPTALKLPGLVHAHNLLTDELAKRQQAEQKLLKVRDDMETRTSQLTVRDRRLRSAMAGSNSAAVGWDAQTNRINWEIGAREVLFGPTQPPDLTDWSQVLAPAELQKLRAAALQATRTGRSAAVELPLQAAQNKTLRMAIAVDTKVGNDGAMVAGIMRVLDNAATR